MKVRSKFVTPQSEADRVREQIETINKQARDGKVRSPKVKGEEGTVQVQLGREIIAQEEERAEKIARIKELVQSGKYQSDSAELAQKLAEHIDEEIFYRRLVGQDN